MSMVAHSASFAISFGSTDGKGRGLHSLTCRPGVPVRLHHLGAILPPSDSLLSGDNQADTLREALKRLCGSWDRTPQRLMDRYFAFLLRRIQALRGQIEKQLAPYHGIYKVEDTLFSAPALLPKGRIERPDLSDIPVSALVWSGDQLTALLDSAANPVPQRLRERLARLEAAGITIRMIEPALSPAGDDDFFVTLLGPAFERFFETEPLPCAPLPPDLAPDFLRTVTKA